MATIHIFLNDDEIRQAVYQSLIAHGVDLVADDIHFIEASSGERISVEVEAMNVKLSESFTGFTNHAS